VVPGSGFKVQRLQPMDNAHTINQNPAYPSFDTSCLGFIQPGTLNPEP
jgi:hypothetical protein